MAVLTFARRPRPGTGVAVLIILWLLPAAVTSGQAIIENIAERDVRKIYRRALTFMQQADYGAAIKEFRRAVERVRRKEVRDPEFEAEFYSNFAWSLYQAGIAPYLELRDDRYFREAVEMAEKSNGIKPDYWPAYETVAEVLVKMREYATADTYYSRALKYLEPDTPDYRRIDKRQQLIRKGRALQEKKGDVPSPAPGR